MCLYLMGITLNLKDVQLSLLYVPVASVNGIANHTGKLFRRGL
jgi:hypothetical protein